MMGAAAQPDDDLQPDRAQLVRFVEVLFRHADRSGFLALRVFGDGRGGATANVAIRDEGVRLDAPDLIERVVALASVAANGVPAVFAPPVATFRNAHWARAQDLADGVALLVDCDANPVRALATLVRYLGPPTLVVESGGRWTDPLTGEVQPKVHAYWRLVKPGRSPEDHVALRAARKLAADLIGSDSTAVSVAHPMRWPGSWHRKGAPRLARIVQDNDVELRLGDALERLRAVPAAEFARQPGVGAKVAPNPHKTAASADIAAALKVIPNDDVDWADWNRLGMAVWLATAGDWHEGFDAFDEWSSRSPKYDPAATEARWQHFASSPPTQAGAGTVFHLARKFEPGWVKPSTRFDATKWFGEAATANDNTEPRQPPLFDIPEPSEASEPDHDKEAGVKVPPKAEKPKKERKKREHERRSPNDTRPVIVVRNGDIEAVVNQMEAALIARGGFFQRAGEIVSIGEMPIVTAGEQEATALRVIPKGKHAIAEAVSSAACMMKFDARVGEMVVINPPLPLVETLMDRTGRFRLPPLAGVVTAPTLRPDGTVLDRPGYDKLTGLFFEPGDEGFPEILAQPSRAEAEAALKVIEDIIQHFPFVADMDHSVALSAIVTACVRQAIPTAPLHAFAAPVRGSGKSMLADIAAVIATGRPAAVMGQAGDEVEAEKRLTGMLLQGASIIALDNCTAPIDGAFLNAIVTQTVATVRPLGSSRMVDVPSNAFLMAGGNGLVVNGDMTRRTILCSLDPRMERPETRQFDFNPVERAKAERGRLVVAVLTILLAHRAAGAPRGGEPLGSFERWSRVVRDPIVWMGRADPLLSMAALQGEDPEKAELDAVLIRWAEKIGTEQRITVAQLIERVAAYDHAPFRMELLGIAGAGGVLNGRKLGKWLGRHAKRRSNGRWIEQAGISGGNMTWRLRVA